LNFRTFLFRNFLILSLSFFSLPVIPCFLRVLMASFLFSVGTTRRENVHLPSIPQWTHQALYDGDLPFLPLFKFGSLPSFVMSLLS
jgi:hypothetical protein